MLAMKSCFENASRLCLPLGDSMRVRRLYLAQDSEARGQRPEQPDVKTVVQPVDRRIRVGGATLDGHYCNDDDVRECRVFADAGDPRLRTVSEVLVGSAVAARRIR